ncbi:UDP-glucose/GDP-mannose dehydrogenase family protein [Shewanella sp. FJAT-52076]|uniref:UDP-glucose dehydrogenase family protein n=1 Tax=Shewanella sp. FJAT-52076 TaxID=2864202 RepID=UPI001C654A34|nr:UDP-glucose/GDP-mannose dehydrogenase family protein [Shewanella sp. FJAT-52076]QYJ74028.1 UDP-glucose/GDP-mannose dehydrogenase family protein [Shewanella sp. FJAT-52076]
MKVTVFGVGYVGLVQGAVLAEVGHDVLCVDIDAAKIERLNKGQIPIYEPGLEALVKEQTAHKRLSFSTDPIAGVAHGEVLFIAVGTPPDEDGSADLAHVLAVAKDIGLHMFDPKIVVNKSTVPVGTADKVRDTIAAELVSRDLNICVDVVSNPEFLKEGAALDDCRRPDRIIVGSDSQDAQDVMRELYAPFNRNHDRMIFMDVRSAELTKYAANCMLATKISFMNEMANIAEHLGADIEMVRKGIGSDPRIGYQFIYPGCGYGGSCFPKDVKALVKTSEKIGVDARVLKSVEAVNLKQKQRLPELVKQHFGEDLSGLVFALWGLSFKPQTDDMREAPSRVVIEAIIAAGGAVQAFDPEAMAEAQRIYGVRDELKLLGTKEAALSGADGLIVCTEWSSFRAPDFNEIKRLLKQPVIFDGRNLYDPARLETKGIAYYGIGRGRSVKHPDVRKVL